MFLSFQQDFIRYNLRNNMTKYVKEGKQLRTGTKIYMQAVTSQFYDLYNAFKVPLIILILLSLSLKY